MDLIYETLGTLGTALSEEILVTIIVIIVFYGAGAVLHTGRAETAQAG